MKIYAASKEDILRRQRENEDWYNEQNERYQKQFNAYNEKYSRIKNGLKNYLEQELAPYIEPLNLYIEISSPRHNNISTFRVIINSGSKPGNEIALYWRYEAEFDVDGSLNTGSYGYSTHFDVNTPELMKTLELSIECLKTLQNIDWKIVLKSYTYPNISDEVTEENPNYRYKQTKKELEKEMLETDIEDLVGADILVRVYPGKFENDVWVLIRSESPKQYTVSEVPDYILNSEYDSDNERIERYLSGTYRISKDKFLDNVVEPIQTRER